MELMITDKINDLVINIQSRSVKLMENKIAVIGIFIIAAAVLIALAMTISAGIAAYCISEGGNVDLNFGTSKVWKFGLPYYKFRCIR